MRGLNRHGICKILPEVLSVLLAAFCLLSPFPSVQAQAEEAPGKMRIAVFPFENFSAEKNAEALVMPLLRERLKKKGFELVEEDALFSFLMKERVRSTGYISREIAEKLRKELQVSAVLLGAVYAFSERKNPEVGFSARLVDTSGGRIFWSDSASATGEDFTRILGLGTISSRDRLAEKMMDRMLASLPSDLSVNEKEAGYRIAVMPFRNNSTYRNAGLIVTYMFITELFKTEGFIPVEYGEVRKAIVETRTRSRGELDHKSLELLSEATGVDGVVVGIVETYDDGLSRATPPEAVISVRLIDAQKKTILFYEGGELSGDERVWVLDKGRIWSVDNVAKKIIEKIVKRMEKVKWQ